MLSHLKFSFYNVSSKVLTWYYRSFWAMNIGAGVKISWSARLDKTNPRGVNIGSYTAVSFDAAIITHDFVNGQWKSVVIGKNCLIGARAVILPGTTIGDNSIVGTASLVMGDIPSNTVVLGNPARIVERGIVTGKWGIRDPKFLRQEGVTGDDIAQKKNLRLNGDSSVADVPNIRGLIASYMPKGSDFKLSFDSLGVDSFTLITLRAEIENVLGRQISDEKWMSITGPSQLIEMAHTLFESPTYAGNPKPCQNVDFGEVRSAATLRRIEINMPQMSMGGMSEGWLFREIGDVHWHMLTDALGVKSRDIRDPDGSRLYATFTRLRIQSSAPLSKFRENEIIDVEGGMTRLGAGLFFSSLRFEGQTGAIVCEVMSSFSKMAEDGNNTSLLKSQPTIPPGFPIPMLKEQPDFASEYRVMRSFEPPPSIFETIYEIVPQHDINGVGLLYFAAYPIIASICLQRYTGGSAMGWSTVERDCFYFANCDAFDRIKFSVHEDQRAKDSAEIVGTMTRESDGKRIALVRSVISRTEKPRSGC